ncbi:hypothetical protein [Chitinophaga rhizophila]|uniref:hypothetical protein n=1 Tax=Chitinophaga rhizophila TaxID=2866212 RepID=UPI001C6A06DC|nr:hypothetical protein [Chitinophaga rhizophila]
MRANVARICLVKKKRELRTSFFDEKRLHFIVNIKAGKPAYLKVKNEADRGN